jgi:membrane protease YdiL (CAAX protease family)
LTQNIEVKAEDRARLVRSLLIYLVVVFIGGALLAPWLYWLAQTLAPGSHLAHNPFHRFVDRALLGLALIGIWPLLRNLGVNSWREAGLVKPAAQWKFLLGGFALGFGSLACAAVIVMAGHGRQFNSALTPGQFAGGVAGATGTAIVVAALEEILFRGAIFGGLRKFWDWRTALLVSSMVYAIVHFLQNVDVPGPIVWSSGLSLLPQKLHGFLNWQTVLPGFFNLTLVGIILGLAYQRTGNLYCSIGLHAGWIFWLRAYGMLTTPSHGNVNQWLWGTQKLVDGWVTLGVLMVPLLCVAFLPIHRSKELQA